MSPEDRCCPMTQSVQVRLHFSTSFSVTHRGTSRGIEGKRVLLLQSGEHSAWQISATTPMLSLMGEGLEVKDIIFPNLARKKKESK